jgi:hypothetical protein
VKTCTDFPIRRLEPSARRLSRLSAAGRGVAAVAAGVWLAMALVPPLTVAGPVLAAFADAFDHQPA